MPETQPKEMSGHLPAIPRTVERAAGDLVHQAFERLVSSDVEVKTAAEAKRLLAKDEDTEEITDAIQRFVAIATPAARIPLRGARFTRVPWVLVASSAVSIGVTVRNGVRELRVIAALLAQRLEQETGVAPDPALLRKLTLELHPQAAASSRRVGFQPASRPARSATALLVSRSVGTPGRRPRKHWIQQSVSTSRRSLGEYPLAPTGAPTSSSDEPVAPRPSRGASI